MPYLLTSQAFLEQSALLLEAYPETVRSTPNPPSPHSHFHNNNITVHPEQLNQKHTIETNPNNLTLPALI